MTVGGPEPMSTFDAPLLGILQSCGELEPFLDVVLGFLYRKTDFFFPLAADQSMGFPPGAAQAKLLKVFRKYEKMRDSTQLSPQHSPPTPPVTPSNTSSSLPQIQPQPQVQPQPVAPVVEDNVVQGSCESVAAIDIGPSEKKEEIQGNWSTAAWDHHNGGYTETYAWSQSAQDVELKLPVPANIKARDLTIDIKAHSIKAQRMTATGPVVMIDQKLHDPIKTEESLWSLHKENSPNVQQLKNENLQNSAALTSPRWNQKFSSLVPRKKPKTEKGQRVRGPAIQWTAETLFGTADEAKGYITRDAKWKFRYSHQTTEGKKVYYQCTQRAKLGCGALCHVVYHQNGTALLYTNGEQHNHSYHDPLTGLKPNLHKVGPQQTAPIVPTTAPIRLREEWSLATIFPNPNDAKLFIEQEALWKFSYSHSGTIGRKVFYDCTLKAKEGCPAKVQLIYHSGEPIVSYLINGASHKHQSDYVCRKRGLSPQIKDTILEAFDSGFTDTKQVIKFLQLKGLESPTVGKIRLFLNKHRPQGFENVPVSMLQWSTTGDVGGEEDVMGELAAAC